MFETKQFQIEFIKQSPAENRDKFLLALEKKILKAKEKIKEINTSTKFSDEEKGMLIIEQRNKITTARKQREIFFMESNPDNIVRIKHKKTGFVKTYYHNDYKRILKNIRKHIQKLRTERQFICKDTRKLKPEKFAQDNIFLTRVGGVYESPNIFKDINNIKQLEKPKTPKTDESHVGIELEFASVLSKTQLVNLLFKNKLDDCCQLHHEYIEGRHPIENEYEISLIVPESEFKEKLTKLCMLLSEEADANVTFGCGIHVHIDCRNRDVKTVYNNLFKSQPLLYSMVNKLRKDNRFAMMNKEMVWYPIKRGFFCNRCEKEGECICKTKDHIPKEGQERYFGINSWSYVKHKTIEVRIHSGSLNANKINNWIKLLLLIANATPILKEITTPDQLKKIVYVEKDLEEYINNRINHFKTKE